VVEGLEDMAEITHGLVVVNAEDEIDLFHGASLI
jgi:hypothetical protein